jgi:hypothetical protein
VRSKARTLSSEPIYVKDNGGIPPLLNFIDAKNDFGQRVRALEFPGDLQNIVLRVGRDAGRDERCQDASESEEANALPIWDLEPGIPDIKDRPRFGAAAGTFDTHNGDLEILKLHPTFLFLRRDGHGQVEHDSPLAAGTPSPDS